MEKKYTMEEFKKMYNEAEKETLRKLNEAFDNHTKEEKNKENLSETKAMYILQNIMVCSELYSTLFKEEK